MVCMGGRQWFVWEGGSGLYGWRVGGVCLIRAHFLDFPFPQISTKIRHEIRTLGSGNETQSGGSITPQNAQFEVGSSGLCQHRNWHNNMAGA